MNRMTWRRVAPAARSSPTSRTCSTTVIDSVLKTRNAPANRAIAAISEVVAWKSEVDARRAAASSCGVDSTYGSSRRRSSRAASTVATSAPASRPMSTRSTAVRSNTVWATCRGTTTIRPNAPLSGPSPARMAMTRKVTRSPAPCMVSGEPSARPSCSASCSEIIALGSPGSRSIEPATRWRSWSCGSAAGSMPRTVTGGGSVCPDSRSGPR